MSKMLISLNVALLLLAGVPPVFAGAPAPDDLGGDWPAQLADRSNSLAWLLATCPDERFRDGQSAVSNATKACELTDYKNAQYLDTLGAACAEAGDFENASLWQALAVELASDDDKKDLSDRLALFQAQKPYRQAVPAPRYKTIEECTAAIERDPTNARAYYVRGTLWIANKDLETALGNFDRAAELDPGMAAAFQGRGFIWFARREYEKSLAQYGEAIRLASNGSALSTMLASRGLVWSALGNLSEALADCNQALRLDAKNPTAASLYAEISRKQQMLVNYDDDSDDDDDD